MNINPLQSKSKDREDNITLDLSSSRSKISKTRNSDRKPLPLIIMAVALLLALCAAGFFFYQYSQLKPKVDNPTQALDEQSKAIKESVAKLYDLRNLNDYSVASITNIDNLKQDNPDFYKNGKNGDYLIVSQTKAILYNKERNIILNVAPIINNPTETTTPVAPPTNTTAPTSTLEPTKKK